MFNYLANQKVNGIPVPRCEACGQETYATYKGRCSDCPTVEDLVEKLKAHPDVAHVEIRLWSEIDQEFEDNEDPDGNQKETSEDYVS